MFWSVLILLLLVMAALGMGNRLSAHWSGFRPEESKGELGRMWLGMQVFWLLALLFPGGIALLGRIPPRSTLLPFRLYPMQFLVAEASSAVLDAPALVACALTLPLLFFLIGGGQWLQAVVALTALLFLSLQTGLSACLLAYVGALGARRFRRLTALPGMTASLFLCLCAGMPPAFASLTTPTVQHLLPAHRTALEQRPSVDWTRLLPSHLAASAVVATCRGDYKEVIGSLAGTAGCLLLTGGVSLWAVRRMDRSRETGEESAAAVPVHTRRRTTRTQAGPFWQIAALVRTEWRLLLRTPQNYLPLRKPASLLLLGVFAFLSPDMSKNPVYNLEEFLAIGTLLYSVLWQLQLLCNRFGNEVGTGALLFGFSIPRRRLLLGKNIALFGLLLLLDSPILVGMAFISEVPERIGLFLAWLPLILLTLTSFGNVMSALQPFTILPLERRNRSEPPDALATAYVLIGSGTVALLMGIGSLCPDGLRTWIAAAVTSSALYAASVWSVSRLLADCECRMITATSPVD